MKDDRIDVRGPAAGAIQTFCDRVLGIIRDPKSIPSKIKGRVLGRREFDWNANAAELGAYSVIDGRHSPSDFEYVTKRTKEILYPLVQEQLDGNEKTLLDFGCGPGRFTGDLAEIIDGNAIGVDVTKKLIEIAAPHPRVHFLYSEDIFEENLITSFDMVFICCVLGGINDNELTEIASNLVGVLDNDGLLFIIESTAPAPVKDTWRIFTSNEIVGLFPGVDLRPIGVFHDANQERTVFCGRKRYVSV